MPSNPGRPPSSREETDRSLLAEREKTDAELEKREGNARKRSDSVVEEARERADALLKEARNRADEALERDHASLSQRLTIRDDRAREDRVVRSERVAADGQLRDERDDRLRALKAILRFEREQTDERLLLERARGDASVAARDDFMAIVAHDVRNLLGGIALGAELQMKSPSSDEAGRRNHKTAQKIQRLAARINRLVGDLYDVNAIETGRLTVETKREDVGSLITEALETFGPAAAAKGLRFDGSAAEGPLNARFDHDRIFQVVANLVSNAIKFTGEGGQVCLRAEQRGGQVLVSVSDSGPGIASDQLQAVFERFWQIRKDDRRGLGLGLFIAKSIIEAHQGRLWVESVQGKGSTFRFTLPGSPESIRPEASAPARA